MRSKEEIMKERDSIESMQEKAVDESVKLDKCYEEVLLVFKEDIKRLDAEQCYEDTLDGKIEVAEAEVVLKINALLDDLTGVTGIEYSKIEKLFECVAFFGMDFARTERDVLKHDKLNYSVIS